MPLRRAFLATLLSGALLGTPGCRHSRKVIVDHDGAIDDYVALVMVLSAPDRRIEGVTISFGNSYPPAAVETTRRILLSHGRQPHVGVYRPEQRGKNEFPPEWRKASAAVDQIPGLEAARRESARDAVTMLRHLLNAEGLHNIDVLVTGPLTNVANALRVRTSLVQKIRRLVVMGGAVRVPGNAPGGLAEYNFYVDPEAAEYILSLVPAGLRLELIPLDATAALPVTPQFLDRLRSGNTVSLRQAAAMLALAAPPPSSQASGPPSYFLWDGAAALALLKPEVFAFQDLKLKILPEGRTVEAPDGYGPVRVALGVSPGARPLDEVVAILEESRR
jgi:purine nucleosidase